jgi:hypothetical protein
MPNNTEAFRARYRASISPYYSAWLHGGFVLAYGALCIGFFYHTLSHVSSMEWLTIPLTAMFCNVIIYVVHRFMGHRKLRFARMFYERHQGDHHSFFSPESMRYDSARDWRVILFPAWLIVVYTLGAVFPAWFIVKQADPNVAGLFAATTIVSYLAYEIFHACEHLPDTNPVARLPWISQMRRLHELHHRRNLMRERNFNIVIPLSDYLFRTFHWERKN